MTFEDVVICFGGKNVVWGWPVFDAIFNECNVITMCQIRKVCPEFQRAVDYAFVAHGEKLGVDMLQVARRVDKLVNTFGISQSQQLISGDIVISDTQIISDNIGKPSIGCSCRTCKQQNRLREKFYDNLKCRNHTHLEEIAEEPQVPKATYKNKPRRNRKNNNRKVKSKK